MTLTITCLVTVVREFKKKLWCPFSQNFHSWFSSSMRLSPQPVGLLKLMLNLICTSSVQARELCWHDFVKYMINIVLCRGTCGPICFKLGKLLDMTGLYRLIPVWMPLMFAQGHSVTRKLEVRTHASILLKSCIKQLRCSWWLCNRDDCEEALHGKQGWFEQLLFLFYLAMNGHIVE